MLDQLAAGSRAIAIIALSLAVITLVLVSIPLAARLARDGTLRTPSPATLDTYGAGRVEAPPSSATMQLHFDARGATAAAAITGLNIHVRAVTRVLGDAGIADDDIATSQIATSRSARGDRPWVSTGTLTITIEPIGTVDEVINALKPVAVHIRGIDGPRFDYDEDGALEQEAMAEAVARAREKADDAAKRTGMRVVGVRSIEEQDASVQRPDVQVLSGRQQAVTVSATLTALEAARSTGDTALGEHGGRATATARVYVVFELDRR